jgi:pimeloyl-ACP methyl ester carboxylesterase
VTATADRALAISVEGPQGAPTLVFLHGWPDDPSLWRHQVEALRDDFRCVLLTLPNFGATPHEPGGCDFPELVKRLARTIEALGDSPVTLITHDWGAYIGYLYEKKHPERIESMVAMDIGGHMQPSTLAEAAMFVSYQWALATFWIIGGVVPPLGTWLTRTLARLIKVPERQVATLTSRLNYPYFYLWRSTLLPWLHPRLIGRYRPRCPVLFIYGGKKPLMFHSRRWLDIVDETGGRSACIEKGSHWFMETEVEETNLLVSGWLRSRLLATEAPT